MAVPWADARAEYEGLKEEIDAAIQRVIQSGGFQHGDEVDAFEKEFVQFLDVGYAIGAGSCYGAMLMGLLACGVGPGDEVITVANTDIATAAAISHTGAAIVWVDIDERTYNIDPGKIEARITPRAKAILPVHMYGLPADMAPIMDIAQRHDLWIIEDAALSVGARYKGRRAGTHRACGFYSWDTCHNTPVSLICLVEQFGVVLAGEFDTFYHDSLAASNQTADLLRPHPALQ